MENIKTLSKFTVLSFQPDGLYSEQNTWKSRDCSERQEIFLRVEFAQNDTQNIDPDSIRRERILSYRALDRDKFAHY